MSDVPWAPATDLRSGRGAEVPRATAPRFSANSQPVYGLPFHLNCLVRGPWPALAGLAAAGLICLASSTTGAETAVVEPRLGPALPENLRLVEQCLGSTSVDWMHREHLRIFGWIQGGYTWSDTGDGLLSKATRPNRSAMNGF